MNQQAKMFTKNKQIVYQRNELLKMFNKNKKIVY